MTTNKLTWQTFPQALQSFMGDIGVGVYPRRIYRDPSDWSETIIYSIDRPTNSSLLPLIRVPHLMPEVSPVRRAFFAAEGMPSGDVRYDEVFNTTLASEFRRLQNLADKASMKAHETYFSDRDVQNFVRYYIGKAKDASRTNSATASDMMFYAAVLLLDVRNDKASQLASNLFRHSAELATELDAKAMIRELALLSRTERGLGARSEEGFAFDLDAIEAWYKTMESGPSDSFEAVRMFQNISLCTLGHDIAACAVNAFNTSIELNLSRDKAEDHLRAAWAYTADTEEFQDLEYWLKMIDHLSQAAVAWERDNQRPEASQGIHRFIVGASRIVVEEYSNSPEDIVEEMGYISWDDHSEASQERMRKIADLLIDEAKKGKITLQPSCTSEV